MYGTREIHNIKLHWDIVMLETWDVEIFTRKTPNDLVSEGYMEEVKENKEDQEKIDYINHVEKKFRAEQNHSILEKLREELQESNYQMENWEFRNDLALDLLTSLEQPKEETIHIPPVSEDGKWVNKSQPQEDIELPEFDYDKLHIEAMEHGVTFAVHVAHQLCKQVELLTNIVNQLIKANKKLWK